MSEFNHGSAARTLQQRMRRQAAIENLWRMIDPEGYDSDHRMGSNSELSDALGVFFDAAVEIAEDNAKMDLRKGTIEITTAYLRRR